MRDPGGAGRGLCSTLQQQLRRKWLFRFASTHRRRDAGSAAFPWSQRHLQDSKCAPHDNLCELHQHNQQQRNDQPRSCTFDRDLCARLYGKRRLQPCRLWCRISVVRNHHHRGGLRGNAAERIQLRLRYIAGFGYPDPDVHDSIRWRWQYRIGERSDDGRG